MRLAFLTLKEHQLYVKFSKCEFWPSKVHFLGHVISAQRIFDFVNPTKIEVVNDYKAPRSIIKVRSFLGLACYFRRFVEGFSKIPTPFTTLTRKGKKYEWIENCEESFCELHCRQTIAPILIIPTRGISHFQ